MRCDVCGKIVVKKWKEGAPRPCMCGMHCYCGMLLCKQPLGHYRVWACPMHKSAEYEAGICAGELYLDIVDVSIDGKLETRAVVKHCDPTRLLPQSRYCLDIRHKESNENIQPTKLPSTRFLGLRRKFQARARAHTIATGSLEAEGGHSGTDDEENDGGDGGAGQEEEAGKY